MFWKERKYLYITFGLIFLISFAVTYLTYNIIYGGSTGPGAEPQANGETRIVNPSIKRDTVINQEIRYLCGEIKKKRIPASELEGLDYQGLKAKFPPKEGWSIDDTIPNTINLLQQAKGFCTKHSAYRHLGADHGYLAIYLGPLGHDEVILSREDIPLDILPSEIKEQLESAVRFNALSAKDKRRLMETMEFPDEDKLNEAMQNFDEYRE